MNRTKQINIQSLIDNFNNNLKQLRLFYARLINNVIRSRNKPKIKKILINKLNIALNNAINNLKNKLNSDINNASQINFDANQPINNEIVQQGFNKSALLIGINYVGTPYELNGCINDANNINSLLLSYGFKNITFLTDNTSEKPIRNNIINEFTTLLSNSNSGDINFFFYSGHGSYQPDTNHDENTSNDQLIVPSDFNVIVDDDLKTIINNNLKNNVTLIALFDSCFSESVLDLKYQYMDTLNNNNDSVNNNETETNGNVIMIGACSDTQTSEDAFINNLPQGALTWAFLQTFYSQPNQTWRQLLTNMRNILKNNGFTQIPQLASGKFINIDTPVFI